MNEKFCVIVLGAGASGLALGWRLATHGVRVEILEASEIVGGLASTEREDGYCLDFGPHSFFSEDHQIQSAVLGLFEPPLSATPRRVKFYYRGKYLDYPLTPTGVLLQMGLWSGLSATLSFLAAKLLRRRGPQRRRNERRGLGHQQLWQLSLPVFLQAVHGTVWKVPCAELSARSIPSHTRMSFMKTLSLLLRERLSGKDLSLVEREKLPTYYLATGFGEIKERVATEIVRAGGTIRLGSPAETVQELPDGRIRVTYRQGKELLEIEGDYLVSTIPLHLFVSMLRPSPTTDVLDSIERLDYRVLVMLGLVTNRQDILDCGYIYQLDQPYNRISEMNKFNPATSPPGESMLCAEISCLRGSAAWRASKEELFDICAPSLASDRILAPGDVTRLMVVRAPYAYPIYRLDYRSRHPM